MPRPEPLSLTLPWRIAMAAGAAAACGHWFYRRLLGDTFPAPFYASDVALVSLLAALPLLAGCADWLRRRRTSVALLLATAVCALWLPRLYIQARCRHDLARLDQLVAQSRVGEAAALSRQLAGLAPQAKFRGLPMRTVAIEMTSVADELRARAAAPLPASATDQDRLARARDLAQLGEPSTALSLLDSSPALTASFEGQKLRGLVCLDRHEFAAALAAFEKAAHLLSTHPPRADSIEESDLLRPIAYCERQLGRYAEAEAAYRELLVADPSADTHFLLAQFYRDAQQAKAAQFHARQAMALDSERYGVAGQRLIDGLVTSHFGCWGVFASERASAPTSH